MFYLQEHAHVSKHAHIHTHFKFRSYEDSAVLLTDNMCLTI